jgi:hypothetical protein
MMIAKGGMNMKKKISVGVILAITILSIASQAFAEFW